MPEAFFYTVLGLATLACCAKLGYEWLRLSTTRRIKQRLLQDVERLRRVPPAIALDSSDDAKHQIVSSEAVDYIQRLRR